MRASNDAKDFVQFPCFYTKIKGLSLYHGDVPSGRQHRAEQLIKVISHEWVKA